MIGPIPFVRSSDADRFLAAARQNRSQHYEQLAYLERIDQFDHRFFNLSAKEASLMDPHQRLLLQTIWAAIEDAGCGQRIRGSRTGIFLGQGTYPVNSYSQMLQEIEPESLHLAVTGNVPAMMASRISHLLDLKGPSLVIDTACSSSLTAVHIAVQSLRRKECDMALVGTCKLHLLPVRSDGRLGIESEDRRTKAFDDSSDGTGGGEGVIAVLLKPVEMALKDGDPVYAVIKGSALNNDGASVGLTAPNPDAQAEVIVDAWRDAGIHPETISYLEAHGTGTKLGDPVEVQGITRAFRRFTDKTQYCALGSVKTNIGHLDHAAGLAGFLKAVLSLHHRFIPPHLHFEKPNRSIDFEHSPVFVVKEGMKWDASSVPRRCGVSSFGFSGTNCHVILEEAPPLQHGGKANNKRSKRNKNNGECLLLSARDPEALHALVRKYYQFIVAENPDLGDFCFTINTGRMHHEYRIGIVFFGKDDLIDKLAKLRANLYCSDPHIFSNVGDSKRRSPSHTLDEQTLLEALKHKHLLQLCQCYADGANIDWRRLYGEEERKSSTAFLPFPETALVAGPSLR